MRRRHAKLYTQDVATEGVVKQANAEIHTIRAPYSMYVMYNDITCVCVLQVCVIVMHRCIHGVNWQLSLVKNYVAHTHMH